MKRAGWNNGGRGAVVQDVTGLGVVLIVLVLATAFGLWRRQREGSVRPYRAETEPGAEPAPEAGDDPTLLDRTDLGRELGARATLVQFSTAFCQPCRATRGTLSHIAESADGVEHVEIDAESNLELVRRVGIARTPTTLILDGVGRVVGRATGVPRVTEVRETLDGV